LKVKINRKFIITYYAKKYNTKSKKILVKKRYGKAKKNSFKTLKQCRENKNLRNSTNISLYFSLPFFVLYHNGTKKSVHHCRDRRPYRVKKKSPPDVEGISF